MLDKFIETLYHKVFVNIVVEGMKTTVYLELCRGNEKRELLDSVQDTFETQRVSAEMLEFIDSYTKETPYFYISVLDSALDQGAMPTCDKNRFLEYKDLSTSEYKCKDESWTYYTSKTNLYTIEKTYHQIGVDFIFSPFTLLANFFKDKICMGVAMFVLIQENTISLTIFENYKLLYAQQLDMLSSLEEDLLSSGELDEEIDLDLEGIDLDDIDIDLDDNDLGLSDDFADIEDLDSIAEIDEFAGERDIEEELYGAAEEIDAPKETEDISNTDFHRFSLIQASIARYYKDLKYESSFIENVYIADSIGASSDLKKYLEEEMFLNVYVRHIELGIEVCRLAKMEVK